VSEDADRIASLRKSLKVPQRVSLIEIIDETLEIMARLEKRIRALEKNYEETD
jgi:hypothetical protein